MASQILNDVDDVTVMLRLYFVSRFYGVGLTSGFVRLTMWLNWLCGFDWLDRLLDSTPLIVSGDSQSCGNKSEYVVTRPCIPLDRESPLTITHNDLG